MPPQILKKSLKYYSNNIRFIQTHFLQAQKKTHLVIEILSHWSIKLLEARINQDKKSNVYQRKKKSVKNCLNFSLVNFLPLLPHKTINVEKR